MIALGCVTRHGESCLCRYCAPSPAEITARLDGAISANDMAMIALCREALGGDRRAVGSLYVKLQFEQLMAVASTGQPAIGDLITEGMGLYRVTGHIDGTRYSARSCASGVEVAIDFAHSGYRDQANAWRIVPALALAAVRGRS